MRGKSKMASEQENNNSPLSKNNQIDCKSRRSILYIENVVTNKLKEIIKCQNGQNEPLEPMKDKIIQNYRSALISNILIDGNVMTTDDNDLDTTTEYEPFDTGKDHYIQHVMLDKLETQMVKTTQLRKTNPARVRRLLKKLTRPELKYLALVNVESGSYNTDEEAMETEVSEKQAVISNDDIENRLQETMQQNSDLIKKCDEIHQKSKNLVGAIQLYRRSESSAIQQAVCETPPLTPDGTDSRWLLDKYKPISKKLDI